MWQVLLAALLWGFGGAFAGRLMTGALEPQLLIPLRFFGSFLLLLPLLIRFPPARGRVPYLLALGLAMALTLATYYLAIHGSSVATALFLQYLAPVLLTLYALFRRERLPARSLVGVGVAVAGAYVLVVGPEGLTGSGRGVLFGLASAFFFALYSQLGMHARTGPWTVLAIGALLGSVLSLPFVPWEALVTLSPQDWAGVAYLVVFATVLPFGLFLWGVQRVSARLATLVALLEPLSGSVFAVFLVGQPLQAGALLGGGLILVGVWLNAWRQKVAEAVSVPGPP